MKPSMIVPMRRLAAFVLGASMLLTSSAAFAQNKSQMSRTDRAAMKSSARANYNVAAQLGDSLNRQHRDRYVIANVAKQNGDAARDFRNAYKGGFRNSSNYSKGWTHQMIGAAHERAARLYGSAAAGKSKETNKVYVPKAQREEWARRAQVHARAAEIHNKRGLEYKTKDVERRYANAAKHK